MKFFFDENLSFKIANMLHAFCDGEHEVIHIRFHPSFQHNNLLSENGRIRGNSTPDEEWIAGLKASREDWKVVSHDSNILDKPHLRPVIEDAGLTFFACDSRRWPKLGRDQAWRMVQVWDRIVEHAREPGGSLFRIEFGKKTTEIRKIPTGTRARGGRLRP